MSELILCNVFIIHENDTFYLQVSFNSSLFFILHFFQKGRKKVKKKITSLSTAKCLSRTGCHAKFELLL